MDQNSMLMQLRNTNRNGEYVISPFWFGLGALVLSLAWLLPNHYPPWAAFHADAWTATVLSFAVLVFIFRAKVPVEWNVVTLLVLGLSAVPGVQFAFGLISFAGQAWITTTYLLGLLLAIHLGQLWERVSSEQLADGLFAAVGVAAVVSVNLQLRVWLGLTDTGLFDIWSMGLVGDRPYGNLGQPNQLATLLMWGLIACAWGVSKKKIGAGCALLVAGFLLLGIALTQSRTAWLGLTFLTAAVWVWRRFWHTTSVCWGVTGLYALFWVWSFVLKWLTAVLLLAPEGGRMRPLMDESRLKAWKLFLHAALERPWFGYGWSEVGQAQLAVASEFPSLHLTFGHSHNIFIDLVLWVGIPLGVAISFILIGWFARVVRSVSNDKDALLLMFLGVVGIHALLELPLHYAYFLLPVGLVVGVLNSRVNSHAVIWRTPRWTLAAIWLIATALLLGVIRDYLRVESSFQTVRFELARIGNLPPGQPPDVVLLTQLREQIRFMRYEPKAGMSDEDLLWIREVANSYPGSGAFYKTARALALNNLPKDARVMLSKVCKISSDEECDLIRRVWEQDAQGNESIAVVPWPQ